MARKLLCVQIRLARSYSLWCVFDPNSAILKLYVCVFRCRCYAGYLLTVAIGVFIGTLSIAGGLRLRITLLENAVPIFCQYTICRRTRLNIHTKYTRRLHVYLALELLPKTSTLVRS